MQNVVLQAERVDQVPESEEISENSRKYVIVLWELHEEIPVGIFTYAALSEQMLILPYFFF